MRHLKGFMRLFKTEKLMKWVRCQSCWAFTQTAPCEHCGTKHRKTKPKK